jgi:hypothetical protein
MIIIPLIFLNSLSAAVGSLSLLDTSPSILLSGWCYNSGSIRNLEQHIIIIAAGEYTALIIALLRLLV